MEEKHSAECSYLKNNLNNFRAFSHSFVSLLFQVVLYNNSMKDGNLVITESIESGKCIMKARGRIDANSSDVLLHKLENALKNGFKNIILNMAGVEYLSSIGIRVILNIYKKSAEAGGTFKIERPSEIVKNILGMIALKQMLVTN